MDDTEILKNRLRDLADKSYKGSQYTFTDFLGVSETAVAYTCERELAYAGMTVWGGYDDSERCMVRFGNAEELGYDAGFPIAILKAEPLAERFADDLTHRDFLGALMNLGIERSVLGDIRLTGKAAYIFCLERMAEYICRELIRVKHTTVTVKRVEELPELAAGEAAEKRLQVNSDRIDLVISKLYNLSRSKSAELFSQKKIFVNGRQCENISYQLKAGDRVTVRGAGRFTFIGDEGVTRKGKNNIICSVQR